MVFTIDEAFNAVAKLKVIGVGGAGGNAVNRMVDAGLSGVDFIAVNTDAMALDHNRATKRFQIGKKLTGGLGAGANPDVGRAAMEEDKEIIAELLNEGDGTDMLFITAGMGGGTGTGGAPVIAEIARSLNILTVAIVTRPFQFEGKVRDKNAQRGIDNLRKSVDSIIVVPNQKLFSLSNPNMTMLEAFKTADDVLYHGTKGISDVITKHGYINLDFADVKTVMSGMGDALMGRGYSEGGENRAKNAAELAINSPLLNDISIEGAKAILVNITSGDELTLHETNDVVMTVKDAAGKDTDANIIYGAVLDPSMKGKIEVTVIATGFNEMAIEKSKDEQTLKVAIPGKERAVQTSLPLQPVESAQPARPIDSVMQAQFPSAALEGAASREPALALAGVGAGHSSMEEKAASYRNLTEEWRPSFLMPKVSELPYGNTEDITEIPTFLRKQQQ